MKKIRIIFLAIFTVTLFIVFGFTITNDNKLSEVENRELQTFPTFSLNEVYKTSYYKKLSDAFNDQLMLRKKLVKGYFMFQVKFQHYIDNVVIGKDKQLFSSIQKTKDLNQYEKELLESAKLINDISSGMDAKFIFLSIPRKDAVMKDYLPKTYTSSDEIYKFGSSVLKKNLSSNIKYIDAYELFEKQTNEKKLYYENDHHINIKGGDLLYKCICDITGVESYNIEDRFIIKKQQVSGAFNKQIGQSITPHFEELTLIPKDEIKYTRYENDKVSNTAIYGKNSSYASAFMGGDMAYTRVETHRDNLPNIMYVGSSFTNILESLSVPSYNRILSVDYRKNNTKNSIKDYVEKYDIDYVVFIPSQSNDALSSNEIKLHLGLK